MNLKAPLLFILLIFCCSGIVLGQNNIWTQVTPRSLSQEKKLDRAHSLENFKVYHLDRAQLESVLENAPLRSEATPSSGVIVKFPTPSGNLAAFRVVKSPIMASELAAKYPTIKTYKANGIDNPTATMRFSLTQFGFHAMGLSAKGQTFIDPYTQSRDYYMVFYKNSVQGVRDFTCTLKAELSKKKLADSNFQTTYDTDDSTLREFELALGCTAAYGDYFVEGNNPKADIQAQMVIAINRVNEIFERDLAITLEFVANNDDLIFYGDGPNPFAQGNLNEATQNTIDTIIGNANYDIGHSFNLGGGGNAGCVGCVCVAGSKGSGYTGSSNPVGDAFYIDYVAHEMGHQFGAYHTMNTCNRSGDGQTEVEPASGSSIMGYAGICTYNVQAHSDAHFSFVSVRNVSNYVQSISCAEEISLSNQPPVADAGPDYTIPKSTAFVLKGSASDPDGMASLTYNWAQNDPERAPQDGPPQSDWVKGPLYRAIFPTASPKRFLPRKSTVLNNSLSNTWEVTPSVERDMSFSFIVRDNGNNFAGAVGQTDSDLMNVHIDRQSGPFTVLSQASGSPWYQGENVEIQWEVAGTRQDPVDADSVDIKLSIDDGENFSVLLADNTANDGQEIVAVPDSINTQNARVMVMASDNVFYALNTADFAIMESNFVLIFDAFKFDVCQPDTISIPFTLDITQENFNGTVQLSTVGLPSTLQASFSQTNLTQNTPITLNISNTESVDTGEINFKVKASTQNSSFLVSLKLNIYNSTVEGVQLIQPPAESTIEGLVPEFYWDSNENIAYYQFDLALDPNFNTLITSHNTEENSYQPNIILNENTTYYWRVKGINLCGAGSFNSARFETGECALCPSSGTTEYSTATTYVSFGEIENNTGKTAGYQEYPNIITQVDQGETYSLSVKVNTSGDYYTWTRAWIDWNQNCMFDENELYELGYANNVSNGLTSKSPLSITVPMGIPQGKTTMRITTKYIFLFDPNLPTACQSGFDGEVEDYRVQIGNLSVERPERDGKFQMKLYPNPSNGVFHLDIANLTLKTKSFQLQIFNMQGRRIYQKSFPARKNIEKQINASRFQPGLYFVRFKNGNSVHMKKLIVK